MSSGTPGTRTVNYRVPLALLKDLDEVSEMSGETRTSIVLAALQRELAFRLYGGPERSGPVIRRAPRQAPDAKQPTKGINQ